MTVELLSSLPDEETTGPIFLGMGPFRARGNVDTDAARAIERARLKVYCEVDMRLLAAGVHTISPMPKFFYRELIGEAFVETWEAWEEDARVLMRASVAFAAVAFDGWQGSEGLTGEIKMATEMGKPVHVARPEQYTDDYCRELAATYARKP